LVVSIYFCDDPNHVCGVVENKAGEGYSKEFIMVRNAAFMTVVLGLSLAVFAEGNEGNRYSEEEVGKQPAKFFFDKLGKKQANGYAYYAAMWALGTKCEIAPEQQVPIVKEAIKRFKGKYNTLTKIQLLGVMSEAEAIDHSPESFAVMVDALHNHNDKRLRSFAAYSLLWYRDQNTTLHELEKALKTEQMESVKTSISRTIKRIKAVDQNN
jgi:hypothetical protein